MCVYFLLRRRKRQHKTEVKEKVDFVGKEKRRREKEGLKENME